jgi:tetratricopeptide (TPR) repeat protein
MPFGVKSRPDGGRLDFDHLYREVIHPTIEAMNIDCRRLDDYHIGGIWHKTLFTAIISSDIVVADITLDNANVYYELGIRHALSQGRTLLISAGGPIPGNISHVRVLQYEPDIETGRLTDIRATDFSRMIESAISQGQVNDSPIYELFYDIEVILPSELRNTSARRSRHRLIRGQDDFAVSVVERPLEARSDLQKSEDEIRRAADPDPAEYLTLLRRYRDLSDWDHVIRIADDCPENVRHLLEVRQLLALALNRRNKPGDQGRAIGLMKQQIEETGGDSETFGILGRVYKDRYDKAKERNDARNARLNLDRAIKYYQEGFEKNPGDYYTGINVAHLLLQKGDESAYSELDKIVPRVRASVEERLDSDRPDFWALATYLQLAVIAHDWERAEELARLAMAQQPAVWMLETTLRDLTAVRNAFRDRTDIGKLEGVLSVLQPRDTRSGAAYA